MDRIRRPEIVCPVPDCSYVASGSLDLHRHQQREHSMEVVERYREETDAVTVEANHALVREEEGLDRWLEYGGG